ncbi:uncharacterized protein [Antedon mediterranea]|uniref:uncharacterized protein n=1 Tax=Antedon mediterranea TaxID=105859 RepID=UPI003AF5A9ED
MCMLSIGMHRVYCISKFQYKLSEYTVHLLENDRQTWLEVKINCETGGGYLACLTSTDEVDAVIEYVNMNHPTGNYAIGLSREASLDKHMFANWKWETGEAFNGSIPWHVYTGNTADEPNTATFFQCGVRISISDRTLKDIQTAISLRYWYGRTETQGYICERRGSHFQYMWSEYTVNILYGNDQQTWLDVKVNCETSGGYLACLTSTDELDAVIEYVNINHPTENYAIGLSREAGLNKKVNENWKWETGEVFDGSIQWLDHRSSSTAPIFGKGQQCGVAISISERAIRDIKTSTRLINGQTVGYICERGVRKTRGLYRFHNHSRISMDVGYLRCALQCLKLEACHGFYLDVAGFTVFGLNAMMESEGTEHRLIVNLMKRYSSYVRPVYNESSLVIIDYHMELSMILNIDEKNQILTTAWSLEQKWFDEFLTWDPSEYDNLSVVNIPANTIWLPDTVLYNSADVDGTPGNGVSSTYAIVRSDGLVYWPAPAIFKSSCKMDITYFPFDHQYCTLKFGPWVYLANAVRMKKISDGDHEHASPNGQWTLLDMHSEEHLVKYGCCPEPFSDITFYLHLRRKSLFYMLNLLYPTIFVGWMSLIVFFLPPQSGEKVGLNITIMLSLVFFLLLGATFLPPTSLSVSFLGKLFACFIIVMSLETAMSVIIIRLSLHAPNKLPPAWSRYLILDKLAKVMCLNNYRHEYNPNDTIENINEQSDEHDELDTVTDDDMIYEVIGNSLLNHLDMEPANQNNVPNDVIDEENDVHVGANILRIGRYLKLIGRKLKTRDKLSAVQRIWVDMCIIIDRLLLVCFVPGLNVSAIIILYKLMTDSL